MNVTGTVLAILVLAIVLVPGVSAQDVEYSAAPGTIHLPAAMMAPLTVGTITQGETDWYSVVVPSGKSSITTDLNWGYAPDSLTLTVVAPDGSLGPYHDADDGITDGRIFLTFSKAGGITPGTWMFKVYGEYVLGTQSYTFVTY